MNKAVKTKNKTVKVYLVLGVVFSIIFSGIVLISKFIFALDL